MDSGVHQAMLGDQEKPKILSDNSSLEPDWLTTKYRSEKKEMWWDSSNKARYDRNYCGCFVNIFYVFILITEIILWIKVMLIWRNTDSPGNSIKIVLPLLLPSLILPVLAVLHSIVRGRLSYSSACLLIVPPAPIALHFMIFSRKLQGKDHAGLSDAVRTAGLVQCLVTSLPLVIISLVTMLRAAVGEEKVDMTDLHQHLHHHSLQAVAASVSLLNLVVTSLRFNERDSGRAVTLLVGLPFLFTNISFRLIGFSMLFCYFDYVWIFLSVGLMFCISALSVQLSARESLCVRLCRRMVGNTDQDSRHVTVMDGLAGMLVMSLANVFLPCGYAINSRGWRMLVVCWIGAIVVHGMVIHQTIISHVPNTYMGLAPVDMNVAIPKTGIGLDVPRVIGGIKMFLKLPRTEMKMEGDHPAKYQIDTSPTIDLIFALLVPIALAALTVPFTILRVLLLGWNCTLSRKPFPDEDEDEVTMSKSSKSRNCLTVFFGVSGMMTFTIIFILVVAVYILVFIQSLTDPLRPDPSD